MEAIKNGLAGIGLAVIGFCFAFSAFSLDNILQKQAPSAGSAYVVSTPPRGCDATVVQSGQGQPPRARCYRRKTK